MSSHRSLAPLLRLPAALAIASLLAAACGSSTVSPSLAVASAPGLSISSATAGPTACEPSGSTAPAGVAPWWRDRSFYEVFVRSFADSDGDGIGDLRGLIGKLDYLNDGDPSTTTDLGVTALWLMPVTESPSYHGYDVTDYAGDRAGLRHRRRLPVAHDRGPRRAGSTSSSTSSSTTLRSTIPGSRTRQTPGSAHDDWYVWSTGSKPPLPGPSGNAVWHRERRPLVLRLLRPSMPDLNLRNPDVTAAIDDVARVLARRPRRRRLPHSMRRATSSRTARRIANTPETFAWLAAFRDRVHADKPGRARPRRGLGSDRHLVAATSARARSTWTSSSTSPTPSGARSGRTTPAPTGRPSGEIQDGYPPDGYGTFLSNHDQNRVLTQLGGDVPTAKLAATLLFTEPGRPVRLLRRGDRDDRRQAGRADPDADALGRARRDRPGSAPAGHGRRSARTLARPPTWPASPATRPSLLSAYRDLIGLRRPTRRSSHGDWTPVDGQRSRDHRLPPAGRRAKRCSSSPTSATTPVDRRRLALDAGPLCDVATAPRCSGDRGVRPPLVNPTGGFDGYVPVDRLDPASDRS